MDERRYWLSQEYEDPQWREVTKEEYVNAERAAGFHNTMGQPDEPATASFGTSRGQRGTTFDPAREKRAAHRLLSEKTVDWDE